MGAFVGALVGAFVVLAVAVVGALVVVGAIVVVGAFVVVGDAVVVEFAAGDAPVDAIATGLYVAKEKIDGKKFSGTALALGVLVGAAVVDGGDVYA